MYFRYLTDKGVDEMRMWWKAEREREWSPGWDCPRIPDRRPAPPACMENWRYHIWSWHLAERGSKSCFMKERVATTELKKTSLICYFLRLAKAKCGAFDIAVPQTILLSFAIQSQLSDSDSSDAPRTLWLLMAIHAKYQRISTFSYHFLLENIFYLIFKKASSYF